MSNEATVNSSVQILIKGLSYRTPTPSFRADIATANGPTPGGILITTAGVQVDLSGLSTPGLVEVANYDDTNYFDVCLKISGTYYPFLGVLAKEHYVCRFSPTLVTESVDDKIYVRANTANLYGYVGAFET